MLRNLQLDCCNTSEVVSMIFDAFNDIYEDSMEGAIALLQIVLGCVGVVLCAVAGVLL